jgi:citrate lyase subunit beta / citryl-CoA lyase
LKPRRSALYVPADNARALEKARALNADVLILDLEDAVAPDAKARARDALADAVAALRGPREIVIRVNALETADSEDDFKAALEARPDAILLPKVGNADDIETAAALIGDMPLWAMIETPAGVLNLGEIAPGVAGLVLGANDYLKEIGGRHRPDRANLHYIMSEMVLVARAYGLVALDGVHNRLDDASGFAAACEQARDFGFDGKTLIHPSQIAACHAAFIPSADEVAAAKRVLAAFADNPGKGALNVDGRMVERLDADIAERTIAQARE